MSYADEDARRPRRRCATTCTARNYFLRRPAPANDKQVICLRVIHVQTQFLYNFYLAVHETVQIRDEESLKRGEEVRAKCPETEHPRRGEYPVVDHEEHVKGAH